MSIPKNSIAKYFPSTGERTKHRSFIRRCNECGDEIETSNCVRHLFNNHVTIFEELEAKRIIDAIEPKATEGRNNKNEQQAVRPCEFCETFNTNDTLSSHKRRQSYIGGIYGCPQYNEFYRVNSQNFPGYAEELAHALNNESEVTDEDIEQMSTAAKGTPAEDNSAFLKNKTGAVYIKVKKQWMSQKWNATSAAQNWCYTGFSTDVKQRQINMKSHINIVLHTHSAEAIHDDTIALLVLNNIPALLAAAVEQSLIVQRRPGLFDHIKNKNTPYQKKIDGITSAQLRRFSAKALVSALKKKEEVILEADTTTTPKSTRQSVRGKRPSATSGASTSSEVDINNEKWTSRIKRGKATFKQNKELKLERKELRMENKELRKKNRQRQRNEHALKRRLGEPVESQTEQSSEDEELNDSVFVNETFFNDDDDDFSNSQPSTSQSQRST